MAWYDKVGDAASVVFPLWGAGIQGGKAAYNWATGSKTGPFGTNTSYTPPGPPAAATQATPITPEQQRAFSPLDDAQVMAAADPYRNRQFSAAANAAGDMASYGQGVQQDADSRLMQGYDAPTAIRPTTVSAPTPRANTASSGAGMGRAVDQLVQSNQSRENQSQVYGTAMDWAQGNMPSVGRDIANEAGVVAGEQFQRAGSEANQAYGSAAANAAQAYGMTSTNAAQAYKDALAAQTFATQQAGTTAARQTQDAASEAAMRQAALTSMARGGNIGMALRTGLQGAAAQAQNANVQGARLMGDANAQASYNAAAGQRAAQTAAAQANLAAQNAQLQGNLATQGTQERAATAAAAAEQAARFRAAQIGSAEQQAALNLASGTASDLRGADIAATGAATNIGQLGLGMDSLITGADQSNADRSFAADTFNSTQAAQLGMFGQQMGLNYDQLNSGNYNAVANRGMQGQQFGIGTQANMAGQATQQQYQMAVQQIMGNQQLAQMFIGLDEANKQRMLDSWIAQQGIATDRRGQNMNIFGGGMQAGGAILGGLVTMSDKRAKKAVKKTDAPDFSKAGSYEYEYKNPKADGAAPGRHSGPMAQELPKSMLKRGDDGLLRVDIGRLALSLASAMGDVQRRLGAA